MLKWGIATFTLDSGKCPKWLFDRMVSLGREIIVVIRSEYDEDEFVRRMADPVWFQSLGTVLAFDWNASGLTTILTAALKEAIRGREDDFGCYIAGGKGKTSRRTPEQILDWSSRIGFDESTASSLVYNSKIAAKVDSSLVQDGYQLYHHAFFFTRSGAWTVVQQGMSTQWQTARRYHWHSTRAKDIVRDPHMGIAAQKIGMTMNLATRKSAQTQDLSVDLVSTNFGSVMKEVTLLRRYSSDLSRMVSAKVGQDQLTLLELSDRDFKSHPVVSEDFSKSHYLEKILYKLTDKKPKNYESLLATEGVGPKTIRALSLVAELIYGAPPSYEDPARYSFAHGGKDEIPYPVDRETYDQTIEFFKRVISRLRVGFVEKKKIVNRLEGRSNP